MAQPDPEESKKFSELLNAYGGQNKEVLERIYEIGRIESLHTVRSDIVNWIGRYVAIFGVIITALAIFGINEAIKNSVNDEVKKVVDLARGEVEQLRVEIKLAQRQIQEDIKTLRSLLSEFEKDKLAMKQAFDEVESAKKEIKNVTQSLQMAIEEGQSITLALEKIISDIHRIKAFRIDLRIVLEEDYNVVFKKYFSKIKLSNLDISQASSMLAKSLINLHMFLLKPSDKEDDNVIVADLYSDILSINSNEIFIRLAINPIQQTQFFNEKIEYLDGIHAIDIESRPDFLGGLFKSISEGTSGVGITSPSFDDLRTSIIDFYNIIKKILLTAYVNDVMIWNWEVADIEWEAKSDASGEYLYSSLSTPKDMEKIKKIYEEAIHGSKEK